ncbi:hypothetical protein [Bosea sp. PAMC 26642]|uniref:hypothetical protein n=1 Tax=Bosea sp. (strain PAMC 26642) TaxID=1792307 RepID=UPI00076FE493|nr:hypothetical protein [Bosea sp. PAMC 26642]AMJ59363.1 hypothetical protein AXW83_02740 [Bosea sp. PAMC 26642]
MTATMHSNQPLAVATVAGITFDFAAIMRRAHHEARFALQLSRARREPASARHATMSRFLKKAWLAAKAEAFCLRRAAEQEVSTRAYLAARAAEAVSLAASFGDDPDAIRWEIERENYRQHFNPARADALRAALSSMGA